MHSHHSQGKTLKEQRFILRNYYIIKKQKYMNIYFFYYIIIHYMNPIYSITHNM